MLNIFLVQLRASADEKNTHTSTWTDGGGDGEGCVDKMATPMSSRSGSGTDSGNGGSSGGGHHENSSKSSGGNTDKHKALRQVADDVTSSMDIATTASYEIHQLDDLEALHERLLILSARLSIGSINKLEK